MFICILCRLWHVSLNLITGYTAWFWCNSRHWSIRPGSRFWSFGCCRIQKLGMLNLLASNFVLGGLRSIIHHTLIFEGRITGQNDDILALIDCLMIITWCSVRNSHCLCFSKFWLLWGRHFRKWWLSSRCLSVGLGNALFIQPLSLLLIWIYLQRIPNVGHICCKKMDCIIIHRWRFFILIEIDMALVLRLWIILRRLKVHQPRISSHRSLASWNSCLDCELWVV